MKTVLITIVKTWLCATGVAVAVASTVVINSSKDGKDAAEVAAKIAKQGTIENYKAKNGHSSAIRQTTTAKVTKVSKVRRNKCRKCKVKKQKPIIYVPNPIYPSYTNALNGLSEELVDFAKDGEVAISNGVVLMAKGIKPSVKFPEEYRKVVIGGVAMGAELRGAGASLARERIDGTDEWKLTGVTFSTGKHFDEPEFYCTDATYSVIPATKQVYAVKMHGNLTVGSASKAQEMVDEIVGWMQVDYGAVDLGVDTPTNMLSAAKLVIGDAMEVDIAVNWKNQVTDTGCDADINIGISVGEMVEEAAYERDELGRATDAARLRTLRRTGVNYLTISPTVRSDAVRSKVVY